MGGWGHRDWYRSRNRRQYAIHRSCIWWKRSYKGERRNRNGEWCPTGGFRIRRRRNRINKPGSFQYTYCNLYRKNSGRNHMGCRCDGRYFQQVVQRGYGKGGGRNQLYGWGCTGRNCILYWQCNIRLFGNYNRALWSSKDISRWPADK